MRYLCLLPVLATGLELLRRYGYHGCLLPATWLDREQDAGYSEDRDEEDGRPRAKCD